MPRFQSEDGIIVEFDQEPTDAELEEAFSSERKAPIAAISEPSKKEGALKRIWETLSIPEKMSRAGLTQIAEAMPSPAVTGKPAIDIALHTPRIAAETLAEVAPSFVSPESIATAGLAKGAQIAAPIARATGRGLATAGEALSGLEYKTPGVLREAFREPSLLWGKSKKAINELYASLADPKALEEGVVGIKRISDKKEVVERALEAEGVGLLNPDEALVARKNLFDMKKSFPSEFFHDAYTRLTNVAKQKYGELDPLFQRAIKSEALRKFLPQLKSGGTSTMKSILMGASIPLIGKGAGLASPIVQSGIAAGLGGAAKAVRPFIQKPTLGAAASSVIGAAQSILSSPKDTADVMRGIIKSAPEKLGNYAPILQSAAQGGNDEFTMKHWVLSKTDPNYQDMVHKLIEEQPK